MISGYYLGIRFALKRWGEQNKWNASQSDGMVCPLFPSCFNHHSFCYEII
jgi:hypothetical protein